VLLSVSGDRSFWLFGADYCCRYWWCGGFFAVSVSSHEWTTDEEEMTETKTETEVKTTMMMHGGGLSTVVRR